MSKWKWYRRIGVNPWRVLFYDALCWLGLHPKLFVMKIVASYTYFHCRRCGRVKATRPVSSSF